MRRGAWLGAWLGACLVAWGCGVANGPAAGGGYTCGAEIEIADPALLEAVRAQALGEEVAMTEAPLTFAALASLTGLDASGLGVQRLDGLECAKGLERVRLADNAVTDLRPLAALPRLRALDVSGNVGADLRGLAGLPGLAQLTARGIGLDAVGGIAANHPNLTRLDVAGNSLTSLAGIEPLASLGSLDISDNEIDDLSPLSTDCQLRNLIANDNAIGSLEAVAGCRALSLLEVDDNALTSLAGVDGLVALTELHADRNMLGDLGPLSSLPQLEELWVRSNGLADIDAVEELAALQVLSLTDNDIESLAPLAQLPALHTLYARNNGLDGLEAIAGVSTLRVVDVRGNPEVADLVPLESLTALRSLGVGGGAQQLSLAPLQNLSALGTVRLESISGETDLSVLSQLPFLRTVSLRNTPLVAPALAGLATSATLRDLDVSGAGLQTLTPLVDAPALVVLRASNNDITALPDGALWSALEDLRVGDNPLASVAPLAATWSLRRLDAPRTDLDSVAALLDNPGFGGESRLDVRETALDAADCADLVALVGRGVEVVDDLACDAARRASMRR